jgi:hypothetical protein
MEAVMKGGSGIAETFRSEADDDSARVFKLTSLSAACG